MADCYELGYAVERFENAVSRRFHCSICLNVFKDPVMCRRNQHSFCRGCITRHLMNFQTCPICMDQLTLDTLTDPPRILTDYLSELRIRCDYYPRGCQRYIKLDDLERHVSDCGFAPVVCSNEGCLLEVNKSELVYHQTTLCEQRIAKCHNCKRLAVQVDELRTSSAVVSNKLDDFNAALTTVCLETIKAFEVKLNEFEKHIVAEVDNKFVGLTDKLNGLDAIQSRILEQNEQMKTRFIAISEPLAKISKLENDQESKIKPTNEKPNENLNFVIAGGLNNGKKLQSVERFNLSTGMWSEEQAMHEGVYQASSVLFHGQIILSGGETSSGVSEDMARLNIKVKSGVWTQFAVPLPFKLRGHCSVVHDNNLYVIGGCNENGSVNSRITVVQLIPPYTSKTLLMLPDGMSHPSAQLFNDQIIIVGATQSRWSHRSRVCNVFVYDISKNKLEQLAPAVSAGLREMATVRWGDAIIIIGGIDARFSPLRTVIMYNIKTQLSDKLPDLNFSRRGCVAAVLGNQIVVIGGACEGLKCLNSVEYFDFKRFSWQELTPMKAGRYLATGVAF